MLMDIRKRASVVLMLFSIILGKSAHSQPLIITGPDQGKPKYFILNGQASGFIVDITRWVLTDMQYPASFKLLPWKRAYNNALKGRMAIIGLSKNSNRLKIFDYSHPLYFGSLMIVVKKGHEFDFQTVLDLQGKRIGASHGASYGDVFDQALLNKVFEVVPHENPAQGLKLVLNNRIDAVFIGPGIRGVKSFIDSDDSLNMDQFTVLTKPFKVDAKHLGIHKSLNMEAFIQRFNLSLEKAWSTGVVDKLIDNYD